MHIFWGEIIFSVTTWACKSQDIYTQSHSSSSWFLPLVKDYVKVSFSLMLAFYCSAQKIEILKVKAEQSAELDKWDQDLCNKSIKCVVFLR